MMLPDGAAATSDHAPKAPADHPGKAPCRQTVLCQAAPVVAPFPIGVVFIPMTPTPAMAEWANSPEVPSRPPDRDLRPPKTA